MENIQFENQYEFTKSLLKNWYKMSQKRDGKYRIWLAGCLAVSCILIAFIIKELIFYIFALIYVLWFIYGLVRPFIMPGRQLKHFSQITGESKWFQIIQFGENIEVQSGNSIVKYSYGRIRFIEENDTCFCLWINTNIMLTIYKDSFSVGNANEFCTFIEEKCSEQEPLWTKRELNKRILKKSLPPSIVLIIMPLITLFLHFMPLSNTISQVTNTYWENRIETIASVELSNGAVAFGTDGADEIHAMLLLKSGNNYNYVSAHSYSITSIDNYNRASDTLFQSEEFSYSATIVYGVADMDWWNDNITEFEKKEYMTSSFQCGETSFVLYYRFV